VKRMYSIAVLIFVLCAAVVYAETAVLQWNEFNPPAGSVDRIEILRGVMSCTDQGPLPQLMIDGAPATIPAPPVGAWPTQYSDPTVPKINGDLCYELRAVDASGLWGMSNRATVTVKLVPPAAPLNLRVIPPTVQP